VTRSVAGGQRSPPPDACAVIFSRGGIFLRRACASVDTVAIVLQASTTA
jgi:hypothetical protein